MRELLLIEQPLSLSQPRILPRRHCVPFTVGHVRGIVFVDRVLLFTGGDHRSSINPVAYAASLAKHIRMVYGLMLPTELEPPQAAEPGPDESGVVDEEPYFGEGMVAEPQASLLPEDGGAAETWAPPADQPARAAEEQTPFEFVVLEHVLLTMTARQHKRVVYAGRVLEATLAKMGTVERDDSRLYALFPLGNTLSHYELVSRGLMECVRALLEDPRDMREACLTDKARKASEFRHRAHRRAEEMAASYDPDIGKGSHALAGSASSTGGSDSGGPPMGTGRPGPQLHSDSHDVAANQLHDSHNLNASAAAALGQLPGAAPEGADAYTGHSASPIASHQHLRSVLDSAAAAPRPLLVYRFTPPAAARGAGPQAGRARHIVGPATPQEGEEGSDEGSGEEGEGEDAAAPPAASKPSSSSSSSSALSAVPGAAPPARAPPRRPAGESRSHEGDDDEAAGRKRGSAAARAGASAAASHAHQATPHTELAAGAQGSRDAPAQQHASWVRAGGPEAEHPDDAYSGFSHTDAHALGRHEHNHSAHAYAPAPASSPSASTFRGMYDHLLEATDGAGHAARLLHATPHPPSRAGGDGAFPEILRISPDTLSQLELMLESVYHRAAASTIAAVELSRSLGNKQDLLDLQTSNYRNYLLSVSLRMSMISVAVAFATFFSSAFGMNLTSGLEQLPYAFIGVSAVSAASGAYLYRLIDRLTVRNSPTKRHARRLETLQSFLYRLDSNLDAAKETLEAVTNKGARGGRAGGQPASAAPDAATPLLNNAGVPPPRAPVAGGMARLLSNEFGEEGASHAPAAGAGPASLSRSEFKAVHRRTTGRDISDDEVDLLFDLLDVDGDGRLRLEEVLGLYQRTGADGTGLGGQ